MRLKEISEASGVNIVASTGFHVPMFYCPEHWRNTADEETLLELFSSELSSGMFSDDSKSFPQKQTHIRAGIVKAAITTDGIDKRTKTLLTAAGKAAAANKSALMLHTENGGEHALDAIKLLECMGLDESFAFVSMDADLYAPTLAGLEFFYPRLNPGGVIMLHDYNSAQFEGVKKAVLTYETVNGALPLVPLCDIHGTAVIIKA